MKVVERTSKVWPFLCRRSKTVKISNGFGVPSLWKTAPLFVRETDQRCPDEISRKKFQKIEAKMIVEGHERCPDEISRNKYQKIEPPNMILEGHKRLPDESSRKKILKIKAKMIVEGHERCPGEISRKKLQKIETKMILNGLQRYPDPCEILVKVEEKTTSFETGCESWDGLTKKLCNYKGKQKFILKGIVQFWTIELDSIL